MTTAIPPQSGRVVLVTGANSGVGKETAVALAGAGATVAITSRDAAKGEAAAAEVRSRSGAGPERVHVIALDLASFASIRACAADVLGRFDRLDVLVNNAGHLLSERRLTEDGFEMTFGVNHLGHFLLTSLLLERLEAGGSSRVVTVASIAHRGAADARLDDLQSERGYSPMGAYNRSKLHNILFTTELARRQAGTGVSAFAVHPGGVRSGFGRGDDTKGLEKLAFLAVQPFFISAKAGAGASVHAATAPGIEDRSGAYFARKILGNYGPVVEASTSAAARDETAARELWARSEALVAAAI